MKYVERLTAVSLCTIIVIPATVILWVDMFKNNYAMWETIIFGIALAFSVISVLLLNKVVGENK